MIRTSGGCTKTLFQSCHPTSVYVGGRETRRASNRRGPDRPKERDDRNRLFRLGTKRKILTSLESKCLESCIQASKGRWHPYREDQKAPRKLGPSVLNSQCQPARPPCTPATFTTALPPLSSPLSSTNKRVFSLWLGVEPRLPAFRQMCSIKLTSKCTNRYTTKDW